MALCSFPPHLRANCLLLLFASPALAGLVQIIAIAVYWYLQSSSMKNTAGDLAPPCFRVTPWKKTYCMKSWSILLPGKKGMKSQFILNKLQEILHLLHFQTNLSSYTACRVKACALAPITVFSALLAPTKPPVFHCRGSARCCCWFSRGSSARCCWFSRGSRLWFWCCRFSRGSRLWFWCWRFSRGSRLWFCCCRFSSCRFGGDSISFSKASTFSRWLHRSRLLRWSFGFGHCTCWWFRRPWRPVTHRSICPPWCMEVLAHILLVLHLLIHLLLLQHQNHHPAKQRGDHEFLWPPWTPTLI